MFRSAILLLLVGCASRATGQAAGQEAVTPAAPPVVVDPAPAPSSDPPAGEEETPHAEEQKSEPSPEASDLVADESIVPAELATIRSTGNAKDPNDRVVVQHLREIRNCYKTALAKQPDLSGRLIVRFEIGVDGRVSDARAESSIDPDVDACILAVFKGMTFPKPNSGNVVVRYPLIFRAAE